MDFHQALLRRYVKPQHLWGGGGVGGAISSAGGSLASGVGNVGAAGSIIPGVGSGGIGGMLGQLGAPVGDLWHNVLRPNNFTPNVPTDNFQATMPGINQMDFSGPATGGLQQEGAGYTDLGNTFNSQQDLAKNAGQTLGAQQNLYGQQQSLADALLAQSQGGGPNPAQAQFQNNMNQAIKQQAGAVASTRGINPALAAHMASQQGAAMQQGAAGQAAVLQAQQQLGAQQALGSQQQAMLQNLAGQNSTYANQGNLYGQAAGTAGQIGNLGSGIYGTAVGGNSAQNADITKGSLGVQGINAGVSGHNADLKMQGEGMKSGVATGNAKNYSNVVGGLASAIGGPAVKQAFAPGASGGGAAGGDAMAGGDLAGGATMVAAHGGQIPDFAEMLRSIGGAVPGKAKVKGDSPKNDTVDTVLSPDEIVLPRSVSMADDAPEKAAEFVAKLKEKSGKSSGAKGYGKILEKHREVQKHMAALDELIRRQAS